MAEVLTIGEPMALFLADREGPLDEIDTFTKYVAGAEVNFSIGMARLGHPTAYITKLGEDPIGKYIYKFLLQNHIDTQYVQFDSENSTGMQLKAKVRSGDPEVVNYRKNSAASKLNLADISEIAWNHVQHLHLTGIPPALSLTLREVLRELIRMAKQKKIPVSFDPNLRSPLWPDQAEMIRTINELACSCDILLPGIQEGCLLTGSDNYNDIADFYLNSGVSAVIIKLGAKGAFLKTKTESHVIDGIMVKKVVDTVGAGDGFAVGVISAVLEGLSLPAAVRRGTAIGALAVMAPGDNDGLPNREQLGTFLKQNTCF